MDNISSISEVSVLRDEVQVLAARVCTLAELFQSSMENNQKLALAVYAINERVEKEKNERTTA